MSEDLSAEILQQPEQEAHPSGIRRVLTLPLAIFILVLLITVMTGFVYFTKSFIADALALRLEGTHSMFDAARDKDAHLLKNMLRRVTADPCIKRAFRAGEREQLLACSTPLFKELRAQHRITHFYFHNTDGRNFLRVHHPERHGDTIERHTLKLAMQSGETASGLEIGPYGSFVLRTVRPWKVAGKLIGYLELGEEIEHFTRPIKEALAVDLIFVANKRHITREKWEEGQRILGNNADWNEYSDFVVIDRTSPIWDPAFNAFAHHHQDETKRDVFMHSEYQGHLYHVSALPLLDVQRENVGHIIVLADVTEYRQELFRVAAYVTGIVFLISILFVGFTWLNIGRFEKILFSTQKRYDELRSERQSLGISHRNSEQALRRESSRHQRSVIENRTITELLRLALEPTPMQEYLEKSLSHLFRSIVWLEHLPEGVIFLVSHEDGQPYLEQAASHNLSAQLVNRCSRIEYGECLCGRVAATGTALFSNHVDEQHDIRFDDMSAHGHWVIPIMHHDTLLGVFNIYLPHGSQRDEHSEAFLSEVATVLASGIYMRKLYRLE